MADPNYVTEMLNQLCKHTRKGREPVGLRMANWPVIAQPVRRHDHRVLRLCKHGKHVTTKPQQN